MDQQAKSIGNAPRPDPRDRMAGIRQLEAPDGRNLLNELLRTREPIVLRGYVREWPLVQAALAGCAASYLVERDSGMQVESFVGTPDMHGRFFYNEDVTGFNFRKVKTSLRAILQMLAGPEHASTPPMYMGSTPVEQIIPGFSHDHVLSVLDGKDVAPRIWIGNRSKVAPHFDEADNIACVVAGRRRFTLFPPDQVKNLYVGPLDFTVAGQPASMVDVRDPDLLRHPLFAEALRHARTAELEPGDAIFIPAVWWHHVEAVSDFNILVNYWWQDSPADAGSPFPCLAHGVLTVSHLPPETRKAWQALFEHYVFQAHGNPADHLPTGSRGILEPTNPQLRSRIRQFLLRVLSGR